MCKPDFNRKAFNFLSLSAVCIGFLCLTTVFIWNFLYRTELVMNGDEAIVFGRHGLIFYFIVFILGSTLFLIRPLLDKIKPIVFFAFCSCVFSLCALYLVLKGSTFLRGDPGEVFNAALALNEGDITSLLPGKFGYLKMYFRQIGLVSVVRFLFKIKVSPSLLYLSQVPMILVINFCLWQISATVYGKHRTTENVIILLSFVFLPQLFLVLFFYKDIIAVCLMCIALLCLVKSIYGEKHKILLEGLFVVFMALAVLMHNALLLALAAVSIVLLLFAIKEKSLRHIIALVCLVALSLSLQPLLVKAYEKEFSVEMGSEMPSSLLLMGISEYEDTPTTRGWFNPKYMRLYFDENVSDNELKQIIADETRERVHFLFENPGYANEFFRMKMITTWTDPTYESVWCGPLADCGQFVESRLLENIYSGGEGYEVINKLCGVYSLCLFGFALNYLIIFILYRHREPDAFMLFAIIFFIGTFLFFIVSETKSRYVYPCVLMLIPLAGKQISNIEIED